MIAAGDVLAGRYAVEALLALGGMADVYRARDVALRRPVAIKAFRASNATPTDADRFEREAQLLSELDHPNLVRLLDAGHHDEAPYLVLELVDGPTLTQRLGHGPLSPTETQQLGRDIAGALAYVHARGVVHRDVKPSNILLRSQDGRALLTDFGIAQPADGTRLTAARTTVGTAAYVAPEQVGGGPATGAADVYALGLVLAEAMTGQRAFDGTQHEMLAARMTHDPYIPPVLPPAWVSLLQTMTRRDPTTRPEAAVVAGHLSAPTVVHLTDELGDTQDLLDTDLDSEATAALPTLHAGVARRHAAAAEDRIPVGWLAALVPVVLLAVFLLAPVFIGGGSGDEEASTTPSTPRTTAPATTAAQPPSSLSTTVPSTASPVTEPVQAGQPVSLSATCADLDAQRQALDQEKQRIDEAYRHDRATRNALKDQLEAQKEALNDQRRALGC